MKYISEEEFTARFRAYQPKLYARALSIMKNPHLAEEVVQESMAAYYKVAANRTFPTPKDELNFLYKIVRNEALEALEKQKKVSVLLPLDELEDSASLCAGSSYSMEDILTVKMALEQLNRRERDLIRLYGEGYKPKEIAQLLGMKEKSVPTAYFRARKRLIALIGKEEKRRG